jgi:hypothetical protein
MYTFLCWIKDTPGLNVVVTGVVVVVVVVVVEVVVVVVAAVVVELVVEEEVGAVANNDAEMFIVVDTVVERSFVDVEFEETAWVAFAEVSDESAVVDSILDTTVCEGEVSSKLGKGVSLFDSESTSVSVAAPASDAPAVGLTISLACFCTGTGVEELCKALTLLLFA